MFPEHTLSLKEMRKRSLEAIDRLAQDFHDNPHSYIEEINITHPVDEVDTFGEIEISPTYHYTMTMHYYLPPLPELPGEETLADLFDKGNRFIV